MWQVKIPLRVEHVRYERNVELGIDPECHEVTSHAKDPGGYVVLQWDGFKSAHRWAYWKATGERPPVVMHRCDNPCCINLAHLKAGTLAENNADRDAKGRTNRRQLKTRLLSDEQVREIRRLLDAHVPHRKIAVQFGINRGLVGKIRYGQYYRDVL